MLLNCKLVLSFFAWPLASEAMPMMSEVHDDVVLLQTTLEHSDRRGGDGEGMRASCNSLEEPDCDTKDYSQDIHAWMEQNLDLVNAPSTALPRTTEAEASLVWEALQTKNITSDAFHEGLQRKFIERLFDGGPGILTKNENFRSVSKVMSKNSLVQRLGDLQVKQFRYSAVGSYQDYPYVASNISSALDRSESFLKAEGTRRYMMFSETAEQKPLEGQVEVMTRLDPLFLPLPVYAMPMDCFHNIAFVDPLGSSHSLHTHGAVWHLQTAGRKAWWVMDPKHINGIDSKEELSPGFPEIGGITPNACAFLSDKAPPEHAYMFIQQEGETVLLPDDYWHSTCALDDYTSAAGGWMSQVCPPSNAQSCHACFDYQTMKP